MPSTIIQINIITENIRAMYTFPIKYNALPLRFHKFIHNALAISKLMRALALHAHQVIKINNNYLH